MSVTRQLCCYLFLNPRYLVEYIALRNASNQMLALVVPSLHLKKLLQCQLMAGKLLFNFKDFGLFKLMMRIVILYLDMEFYSHTVSLKVDVLMHNTGVDLLQFCPNHSKKQLFLILITFCAKLFFIIIMMMRVLQLQTACGSLVQMNLQYLFSQKTMLWFLFRVKELATYGLVMYKLLITFNSVEVYFFAPSQINENIFVRETRGRGAKNTVSWNSIIRIAQGYWRNQSSWIQTIINWLILCYIPFYLKTEIRMIWSGVKQYFPFFSHH